MIQAEEVANRKHLLELKPKTIIIDASEQPIERPVKRQQDYFSGKKRYQGIEAYHKKLLIPVKKKKGHPLTAEEKAKNKALSKRRILIENVNRRCKIFRIVKEAYRGKHKNYSLAWNLVAALVNARYDCI